MNIVYIIDCLSESGKSKISRFSEAIEFPCFARNEKQTAYCGNKISVLNVLNSFRDKARSGEKFPLVFISHGDYAFLSLRHTNEQFDWYELRSILLDINKLMNGDLIVMMACCHGFSGYKIGIRDSKSETFFGIIGPVRTISPEESNHSK